MASGEFKSPCEVLILTNDHYNAYQIDHTINITSPKLFLGRPIRPPMLNSTNKIVRLFDGQPGGRLETRAVTLVRGFGWKTLEDGPSEGDRHHGRQHRAGPRGGLLHRHGLPAPREEQHPAFLRGGGAERHP